MTIYSSFSKKCMFLVLIHGLQCSAFLINSKFASSTLNNVDSRNSQRLKLEMCICIDCARVTNCAAYHFVETKHEQPHMSEKPDFTPRDGSPTIHVNVRTVRENDEEIKRMWKEHKAETERAEKKQNETNEDGPLKGETVYDLAPVTTYEYDVVECDDYVHDKDCWIRNMPEEIKLLNPNFVPT